MLQGMLTEDTVLLMEVAAYAAVAHRNQRRKGREKRPYINHCLIVSQSIAAAADPACDVCVLCAAILHDIVEDTPVSSAEVREAFGDTIADYVAEVTDDKSQPKAARKAEQVAHAPHLSPGACLIKVADKISNVRDLAADRPSDWTRARMLEYVSWSEQVVAALPHQSPALLEDFQAACAEARASLGAA
jgi:(p)ppGpp synthase/HD superfamily hydrolase